MLVTSVQSDILTRYPEFKYQITLHTQHHLLTTTVRWHAAHSRLSHCARELGVARLNWRCRSVKLAGHLLGDLWPKDQHGLKIGHRRTSTPTGWGHVRTDWPGSWAMAVCLDLWLWLWYGTRWLCGILYCALCSLLLLSIFSQLVMWFRSLRFRDGIWTLGGAKKDYKYNQCRASLSIDKRNLCADDPSLMIGWWSSMGLVFARKRPRDRRIGAYTPI